MTLADEQARLDAALDAARADIAQAASPDALDELAREYTGRRSAASVANEAIKHLPSDERPAAPR